MSEMIPAWVDGTLTPVEKLAVHQRGLRHRAVSVFVMRGNAVLIQKRAAGKYHSPGLWANTCCTHPLWEETALDCAQRRLAQELGIHGLAPRHVGQVEYRAEVGNGLTEHEVVEIFVAEAPDDLPLALNPAEVAETRWVDLDSLATDVAHDPARYSAWLAIYLAEHRGLIFAAPDGVVPKA